ncbi:efflux RND transporter periplasmic adaptor subunit [Nitrosospira sp. Nsp1]|uniref:efflux RND transporter periplasmic adaptor subunit n=1 Tax=Nitrosospira sp. Nsp1 TaxID=136547 RepID=UPI00088BDF3F|nr:efflux RND transporter periplasmic adaptor subunit [Nitrosospira sp. Nsp1]SCX53958.1 RND family efflux transporter, MFP subunit [Nitrosospira sp. Nsp1]
MTNEDLSRLKIDRGSTVTGRTRKTRFPLAAWLAITAMLVVPGFLYFRSGMAVEVESTTITTAYPSQSFTLLNATGYVVAQRKAAVASKATGRVEWLGVTEGSKVTEGEIIARLENADVTAAMDQAAASVNVAKANLQQAQAELVDALAAFNRNGELLDKGFISPFAYDTVTARYHKAQAALRGFGAEVAVAEANHRAARIAVEQTLIRAPFDGVVLTKSANIGDVVTPFSSALDAKGAVVTMADMDTLEVEADVSESNLPKVKLGQPCEIQLDALPDLRLRGVVQRIVPTVDRAKATVLVKIRFVDHDPKVLPEMSAKVAFLEKEMAAGQRTARVAVLSGAITQRNGKNVIFLLRDGKAVETSIDTGEKIGDMVEVLKGARAGDKVILRPGDGLDNGDKVKTAAK